jgi:trigger factor
MIWTEKRMNFNTEELGATKRKLNVEVPADLVKTEFDRSAGLLRKKARIKGFRPGKVPIGIVKKLFAPQIEQEVTQNLLNQALPEAMENLEETVVTSPNLEDSNLVEGEPFRFSVSFEVKPNFEITGYQGLSLTREKVDITSEMVDRKIEEIRQSSATTMSLTEDRPIAKGDLAVIDYKAFSGEEPIEGAANPNYQLEVGGEKFNPDFEAELVGLVKGDHKQIMVNFPEDHYNPKLAGKEVKFEVDVLDIKEKVVPELNDEFVKDLGQELETVAELTDQVKKDMIEAAEKQAENKVSEQAHEKLLELVEFEVPESMISQELEGMVSNTMFNFKRSGLSMESFGMSEAKLREEYRPAAEKRVRLALILEKIAKDQELSVAEEEINERIMELARDSGQPPEVIRDIYNKNNMMDSLTASCLTEKTLKFILESANIETIDPSESSDVDAT